MDFARLSTWVLVGGTSFLFIVGMLLGAKWVGSKNIPVLSSIANGINNTWKVAA